MPRETDFSILRDGFGSEPAIPPQSPLPTTESDRSVPPHLEVFEAASGRTVVADSGAVRVSGDGTEGTRSFGTFSLISEQVARLNATCLGVPSDAGLPPGPCNVHLVLVSGNGAALVARDVEIPAGATTAIEFPAGVMVEGVRRRLWATVDPREDTSDYMTASVEVFDAPSGKSTLLLPSDFVQSWGWESSDHRRRATILICQPIRLMAWLRRPWRPPRLTAQFPTRGSGRHENCFRSVPRREPSPIGRAAMKGKPWRPF